MSRDRLRRLAGLWLDAVVERHPLVPIIVLAAILAAVPPPAVALAAAAAWALWRGSSKNARPFIISS